MHLSRGRCRLKLLLKRKKWSQAELSRRTGYHARMISHYVNDKKPMPAEVMRTISLALGCRMEDLYEWHVVGDTE